MIYNPVFISLKSNTYIYYSMIYGIGTDLVDIARISRAIFEDLSYKSHVFTKNEIAYCEGKVNKYEHYAARFAAKEALLKAFGIGLNQGLLFKDIEVINDLTGKPIVILYDKIKNIANDIKITNIFVSLSHITNYASAFVILEK